MRSFISFFLFILVLLPFLIWAGSFIHPFFSMIFLTEKTFGRMIMFPTYFIYVQRNDQRNCRGYQGRDCRCLPLFHIWGAPAARLRRHGPCPDLRLPVPQCGDRWSSVSRRPGFTHLPISVKTDPCPVRQRKYAPGFSKSWRIPHVWPPYIDSLRTNF